MALTLTCDSSINDLTLWRNYFILDQREDVDECNDLTTSQLCSKYNFRLWGGRSFCMTRTSSTKETYIRDWAMGVAFNHYQKDIDILNEWIQQKSLSKS